VISKERFDAVLETMELLSNREFVRTLRTYKAGKTKWTKLEDVGASSTGTESSAPQAPAVSAAATPRKAIAPALRCSR